MKKKLKYQSWLVSFDNDGTLTDSHPLWDEIHAETAQKLGVFYEPGLGSKMYLRTAPLVWRDTFEEQYKFYDERFSPMSCLAWKEEAWMDRMSLFPGMAEVLRELHNMGLKLGVVTSSTAARAERPLAKAGVLNLFRGIVSCEDMNLKDKPSIEAMEVLVETHHVGQNRIIHVGDTVYDIKMANNFECKSIGVGYGKYSAAETVRQARPTAMVDTVSEIKYIPAIIESFVKLHR